MQVSIEQSVFDKKQCLYHVGLRPIPSWFETIYCRTLSWILTTVYPLFNSLDPRGEVAGNWAFCALLCLPAWMNLLLPGDWQLENPVSGHRTRSNPANHTLPHIDWKGRSFLAGPVNFTPFDPTFARNHISHCPMMGDGSLPRRCPTKYQKLVTISGDYHL